MLSNGLDGIESAFSDVRILLVCELLLEGFDSPEILWLAFAKLFFYA